MYMVGGISDRHTVEKWPERMQPVLQIAQNINVQ